MHEECLAKAALGAYESLGRSLPVRMHQTRDRKQTIGSSDDVNALAKI